MFAVVRGVKREESGSTRLFFYSADKEEYYGQKYEQLKDILLSFFIVLQHKKKSCEMK